MCSCHYYCASGKHIMYKNEISLAIANKALLQSLCEEFLSEKDQRSTTLFNTTRPKLYPEDIGWW